MSVDILYVAARTWREPAVVWRLRCSGGFSTSRLFTAMWRPTGKPQCVLRGVSDGLFMASTRLARWRLAAVLQALSDPGWPAGSPSVDQLLDALG